MRVEAGASADGGGDVVLAPVVRTVTDSASLADVVGAYEGVDEFVIDVETVGPYRVDPVRNRVLWLGLATRGRYDVIPLGHPNGELVGLKRPVLGSGAARIAQGLGLRKSDVSRSDLRSRKVFSDPPEQLSPGEVFDALRPVLFGGARKIGANVKFDIRSVAKYYGGELLPPPYGDVIVGDFLLDDTNTNQMSLAHICKRRLGHEMPKGVGKEVEVYAYQEVAKYLMGDVRFTWLLWRQISAELADQRLQGVMDLEMDLLSVIMGMEQKGTRIDTGALTALGDALRKREDDATVAAYRVAGRPFNVNSNDDKRQLLFGKEGRGLTPKVLTAKTGLPATSEEALAHHRGDPLVKALMELAEVRKLQSTYVIPYLGGEVVRTTAGKTRTTVRESLLVDGRVHTSFKQHGARTGRMSSSSPNLQNIPARGAYGTAIRKVFVPDPGHVLVVADYAQIEPRVIASLSGDETLVGAFLAGEDIYVTVADQLGVDRKTGKVLVLSIAYGVGPNKISADLGISPTRARELIDGFAKRFQSIEVYREGLIRTAMRRRRPYVTTVLGRRRYIPLLRSRDQEERSKGRRQVFNTVIQGSSADIMKIALVRAERTLPEGADILLTVHDEIVVQARRGTEDAAVAAVRSAMEGVSVRRITVPLVADVGVGDDWAHAKGAAS